MCTMFPSIFQRTKQILEFALPSFLSNITNIEERNANLSYLDNNSNSTNDLSPYKMANNQSMRTTHQSNVSCKLKEEKKAKHENKKIYSSDQPILIDTDDESNPAERTDINQKSNVESETFG